MSIDRYKRQFGSVKPLPGQPGYGMKESERLFQETKNMEHKLNKLRAVMSQQKEERSVKTGGRWASARSDRGSLRSYNKDVKSGSKRKKFIKHNVQAWSTHEVSLWLTALKLDRYIDSFVQNEISGGVLLDVGQDDLDYMRITVLGHRKTLLKEIEKLKRGRSTIVLPQRKKAPVQKKYVPSPPDSKQRQSSSSSTETSYTKRNYDPSPQKKSGARKIHWSHAKPISENEVSGGTVPVNLADGVYDEKRQSDSFQAAVMQWRTGSAESGNDNEGPTNSSGLWSNPFGSIDTADDKVEQVKPRSPVVKARKNNLSEGQLDEAAEHEAFRKAVDEWRNGGTSKASTTEKISATTSGIGYSPNDNATEISPQQRQRQEKKSSDTSSTKGGGGGGRFLQGDLDEEIEHKKFTAAVSAWRSGKQQPNSKSSPTRDIAKRLNKQMEDARILRNEKFEREKLILKEEMEKAKADLASRKAKALQKISNKSETNGSNKSSSSPKKDYSNIWDIEIEY